MGLGNLSIEENAFFYTANPHKTAVFQQTFIFKDNIDNEKLSNALHETKKYFERFNLKPVINKEGKPELIENDGDMPLYEDEGQNVTLGTKETNGYLYAIFYKNNTIRVVLCHILCDGRGARSFMLALLSNYVILKYGENELLEVINKLDLSNPNHKKNMNDVVEPYATANLKDLITMPIDFNMKKDFFVVDKEVKDFYKDYYYSTTIEFDIIKFKNLIKKYDAKPFIFLFMMIADAMIEIYDFPEEKIVANTAVDLREHLNSVSFYNFGSSIDVTYYKKWHDLPLEERISNLKNDFSNSLNYDNMVANAYKIEKMMDKVSSIQNIDWLRKHREEKNGVIDLPLFSCFISNVGKSIYPDGIFKYLENYYGDTVPINLVPDYTIYSENELCKITQNQNFQNEKIMKKLYEKFESFGIKANYIPECKKELSHFDTLKIERL